MSNRRTSQSTGDVWFKDVDPDTGTHLYSQSLSLSLSLSISHIYNDLFIEKNRYGSAFRIRNFQMNRYVFQIYHFFFGRSCT